MSSYFTLIAKTPNQIWSPQFGDYSKKVVVDEMHDQSEYGNWEKGTKFRVIKTDDEQEAINDHIAALNKSIEAAPGTEQD